MWTFGNSVRCNSSTVQWLCSIAIPVCLAGWIAGCGGGSKPQKAVEAEKDSKPAAASKPERVASADPVEKPSSKRKKSSDDEIPLDVWLDDPLGIAANNTIVGGAPAGNAKPPIEGNTEKPAPMADKPASATGSLNWSEFLPMENLQSEVKKVQNRLKASLQNPGTYNGNYKDISADGSVIAALAGIVIEHSEDIKWKANAPLVREFGHEMAQASSGLGKENYEKTKTAFEKIESVMSGTVPPGAPAAAPKRPFSETADRGGLMKRIEKARNYMRDNINTEAKLKSESDTVLHEAMMIATLGRVVSLEDYSSADEPDYKQFAEALIGGAKESSAAVKEQAFKKFQDSMNKVNKSCDQCHANYGNG